MPPPTLTLAPKVENLDKIDLVCVSAVPAKNGMNNFIS